MQAIPALPRRAGTARPLLLAVYIAAVVLFLAGVAQFYDARTGFTALVGFGAHSAPATIPAVKALPRIVQPRSNGYDGQYYVQMAMDPLLRDPRTDRAMDDMPLRARRILFSWTAYALGLGQPPWILQGYALQNVIAWLVLAAVLLRWFPPANSPAAALWLATLFGGGLVWSVRFALLDGPSLLLIALGMAAIEAGRVWLASVVFGISGLGRETNLLAAVSLPLPDRTWRTWVQRAAQAALIVLPFALWFDYIHSLFRSLVFTSGDSLAAPFAAYAWKWRVTMAAVVRGEAREILSVLDVLAISVQAAYVVSRLAWRDPWWRLGSAYVGLMAALGRPLWGGSPATAIRVLLPLALSYNVLLLQRQERPSFWPLAVLGNLSVARGIDLLFARVL